MPEYDDNGKLKSRVLGELAETQADGRIKITNLRIQLYKEGVIEGTLWAAGCVFDRKDKSAVSDTPVRLEKGNMLVTGVGLKWNGDQQHVEILSAVKVTLRNTKLWAMQEIPKHAK